MWGGCNPPNPPGSYAHEKHISLLTRTCFFHLRDFTRSDAQLVMSVKSPNDWCLLSYSAGSTTVMLCLLVYQKQLFSHSSTSIIQQHVSSLEFQAMNTSLQCSINCTGCRWNTVSSTNWVYWCTTSAGGSVLNVAWWRLWELNGGIVSRMIYRVLACPTRIFKIRRLELENKGGNRLTQAYLENGC